MGFVGIKNVYGQDGWYELIREMVRLENEYHLHLDSPDPGLFSPDFYDWDADYRRMSLDSDRFCCFVAFNEKQPVGFACALVEGDPACASKMGHIIDVFVMEEHRGRGLGNSLMAAIMRWFASFRDVRAITLEVWKGNEGAMGLYEKFGFAVRDYEMTVLNQPD